MTTILHTYTNEAAGIAAHVAQITKGFSVALQDTDCGEFSPYIEIHPTEASAVASAQHIIANA
jgi:hypothetical protein